MNKNFLPALLLVACSCTAWGQYNSLNAHSHNDYMQKTPFFLAYDAHFGSIEADIWAVNGDLFVAHDQKQITPERSLDNLYLQPIVAQFTKNGNQAWAKSPDSFQLVIDLKTPVEPTLSLLVEKLKKYPAVFDRTVNPKAVQVIITGNRPDAARFDAYPGFILFDGNVNLRYDPTQRKRVGMYSENLGSLTKWKGTGAIPEAEAKRLAHIIDSVHGLGKTIRFWNAPDAPEAWKTLMSLQVNFLNTDHIPELASFLKAK